MLCYRKLQTVSAPCNIASCLQVGLLISAPLFAEASKYYPALRLMAVGLGAWILSTAGCAFSFGQPLPHVSTTH